MKKHFLVLRDHHAKIIAKDEFLYIIKNSQKNIVAYKHLKAIFINIALKTNIQTCYKIAKYIPLFIIDSNGYIIAKFNTKVENEKI